VSWELLAELARRERRIVEAGGWDELLELQDERGRAIGLLTGPPPPGARALLEEARARSLETETALARALAETGSQLAALRRGRRAVHAYGHGERAGLDTSA
jgi:hypothetical protein